MIAVGDFNIAAQPKDVHPNIGFDSLYSAEELALMHSILEVRQVPR